MSEDNTPFFNNILHGHEKADRPPDPPEDLTPPKPSLVERAKSTVKKFQDTGNTIEDISEGIEDLGKAIVESAPDKLPTGSNYTWREVTFSGGGEHSSNLAGTHIHILSMLASKLAVKDLATVDSEWFNLDNVGGRNPIATLRIDSDNGDNIVLRRGMTIKTEGFKRFFVTLNNVGTYNVIIHLLVTSGAMVEYDTPAYPFAFNNGELATENDYTQQPAAIDEETNRIQVDVITAPASGGGTQYTEADVDASLTGTVSMMEDAGNTVVPMQGDTTNGLKVNVVAGGTSGVQYTEADVDTTITGTAAMMEAAANVLVPLQGTVAGGLLIGGTGTSGAQPIEGVASGVAIKVAGAGTFASVPIEGVAGMTAVDVTGTLTAVTTVTTVATLTTITNDVNIADGGNVISVEESVVAATPVVKTYDWTSGVTAQDVWTPASGKKFVITDIIISASAACVITLFDETDSTTLRVCKFDLTANGGAVINLSKPRVSATANNDLKITTSATGGFLTVMGYEI